MKIESYLFDIEVDPNRGTASFEMNGPIAMLADRSGPVWITVGGKTFDWSAPPPGGVGIFVGNHDLVSVDRDVTLHVRTDRVLGAGEPKVYYGRIKVRLGDKP